MCVWCSVCSKHFVCKLYDTLLMFTYPLAVCAVSLFTVAVVYLNLSWVVADTKHVSVSMNLCTVEPPIVGSPKYEHSTINLSTKDTASGPKIIPLYSSYTFLTSQRGQPPYKEQIELSQSVLYSEVPL